MNLLDLLPEEDHRQATEAKRIDDSNREGRRSALRYQADQRVYQKMLDSVSDWQPPALPDLSQFDEVILDLETTGLRWWAGDRMIGAGIWTPDGVSRYLPIRHKIGPNIPESQFFEWCRRELRGKKITNIRTKFDLHNFRVDGIDLEAQGCTFGDVAHYAALLDDHRSAFNQQDLALAYLAKPGLLTPEECKVKAAHGYELDPGRFAEYPAGLVAPRAMGDVRIVAMLREAMWPLMTEQNLHRVREVEEQIIPVVVEMEHNGCPIDQETLHRWRREVEAEIKETIVRVERAVGIRIDRVTRDVMQRIFQLVHVPVPTETVVDKNAPSGTREKATFADKRLKDIDNEVVQDLRKIAQLDSLDSKFLHKYERSTERDGILRFELHQLPYERDKKDDGSEAGGGGAVSGRFSSAAMTYYDADGVEKSDGANVQQVFAVKNQQKERPFTAKYLVRKLHVPAPGKVWMAADASQIEYRFFAHFSNAKTIIAAYKDDLQWALTGEIDPATGKQRGTDFHQLVQTLIKDYMGIELHREATKRVNFAQVYGAGVRKMAAQLGVPADQIPGFDEDLDSGGPEFQKIVKLSNTYHEMFPEVRPTLRLASHLAMPGHNDRCFNRSGGLRGDCKLFTTQGYPHRGFVRTILGRLARFGKTDRHYSAFNRADQGSAADWNKLTMIAVHNERHRLGLTPRMSVHDEMDCDLHDAGMLPEIRKVFNRQHIALRVPITWEVGTGPNWAEAK